MITVLGDRVLVALRPNPDEIVSEGGIVLVKDPDAAKTPTQGIVMALGQKTDSVSMDAVNDILDALESKPEWPSRDDAQIWCEAGPPMVRRADVKNALQALAPAPFDVDIGDVVIFSRGAGDQFAEHGVSYVVLFESEILGVCEPLSSEAA